MEKALQVPPDRVRQKLIQATQVIINLVKEREEWKIKEEEMITIITELQQKLKEKDDETIVEPSMQENVPPQDNPTPITSGSYDGLAKLLNSRPLSCRLNIPDIITPQKPSQDPISPKRKPTPDPVSLAPDDHGVSLSPLRFSDSSYSSGMQGLQKALQLIDGTAISPPPPPPPPPPLSRSNKSSTPLKDEDEVGGSVLMVEGRKVPHWTTKGNKATITYAAPRLKTSSKPKIKIRNYNNKDD